MTKLVNQGGDNSEEILRLEEQIQLLVDEDLTKALQNRKNFRILEDERPSKSFLNLENAKRGYNEVMLVKRENTEFLDLFGVGVWSKKFFFGVYLYRLTTFIL